MHYKGPLEKRSVHLRYPFLRPERKMTIKEITLRFSDRQYQMLKSFDSLELKEKLNIMCGVIDFILKQVKNETDGKQ